MRHANVDLAKSVARVGGRRILNLVLSIKDLKGRMIDDLSPVVRDQRKGLEELQGLSKLEILAGPTQAMDLALISRVGHV